MSIKPFYWLILLLTIFLSGCATQQAKIKIDPAMNIPLSHIEHWKLNARLAIKTEQDSLTASLVWQKQDDLFDFMLSGPFGATYAHLIQDKKQASLEIPDTEKRFHPNAEILLQQSLGWDFPLDALSYWVKGLPSGKPNEIVDYNDNNQISNIQLGLWHITFSNYKKFQGYSLPKKIKATHPTMTIKVVAKKWLLLR